MCKYHVLSFRKVTCENVDVCARLSRYCVRTTLNEITMRRLLCPQDQPPDCHTMYDDDDDDDLAVSFHGPFFEKSLPFFESFDRKKCVRVRYF